MPATIERHPTVPGLWVARCNGRLQRATDPTTGRWSVALFTSPEAAAAELRRRGITPPALTTEAA